MSSSNDTPMTRFLLAILNQKDLKDIDWNKVAHDPLLPQEITNGHAARMRFSRFRQLVQGPQPQKRNRTASSKNRVTKSKKDGKVKKAKDPDSLQDDADSQESSTQDTTKDECVDSPHVKQEMSQPPPERAMMNSMFNPTSAPMPTTNMQAQFQSRLLTPCSDSDALAASSSYGTSPGSDMLRADPTFDFAGSSPCAHTHEHLSWPQSHSYPAYGVNFGLSGYSPACDHQSNHMGEDQLGISQHTQLSHQGFGVQQHSQSQLGSEELRASEGVLQRRDNNVVVKHENWDSGML
ncbi:hypothetical protein GE09DRAFT_38492 [Coniochaeta sp. 2T2.1]|nr:hypothetical protein GE09DRAFT_38492 [Coniochaeta sp. 2T2.1]